MNLKQPRCRNARGAALRPVPYGVRPSRGVMPGAAPVHTPREVSPPPALPLRIGDDGARGAAPTRRRFRSPDRRCSVPQAIALEEVPDDARRVDLAGDEPGPVW